jgi:hypothetical protein
MIRLLALVLAVTAAPAWGASKQVVAALGDAVPGGGVFVGPSFIGTPSASGSGWVAFRTELVEGPTTEAIIVTNFRTRARRGIAVGDEISPTIGTIQRFLGSPSVNAQGHVAFTAMVKPPATEEPADPDAPQPAGVFVSDGQSIRRVGGTGDSTTVGTIDLAVPVDPEETGSDLPERTPALNDAGDVAFLASVANGTRAAILVRRAGRPQHTLAVATGTPFQTESITGLGPPAINEAGVLAFRATTRTLSDPPTVPDAAGLFRLAGDTLTRIAAAGVVVHLDAPQPHDQPLDDFDPILAINDAGDVAFTAGPVFDPRTTGDGSPGLFVLHEGAIQPVATRGQNVPGRGEIVGATLHLDAGGGAAAPQLLEDGTVVFLLDLDDTGLVGRAAPPDYDIDAVVDVTRTEPTPLGGGYRFASSAPAVDDDGAVSFSAQLAGTIISEALVHVPATGAAEAIGVGDAAPAPTTGILGGPPFSAPLVNDAGDLVFKGFVARGPGVGIFRSRNGAALEALVRVLDPAPLGGGTPPRFLDLTGEPSLNAEGEVAFAAFVEGRGKGIFAAGVGGVRTVATPGDPIVDPTRHNPTVRTVADNPAIMDDGAVVFGGRLRSTATQDPESAPTTEQGLLVADAAGIRIEAVVGDDTDEGVPFSRFRDPSAASNLFALRTELGSGDEARTALALGAPSGLSFVLLEGADLGGGLRVSELRGRPGLNGTGETTALGVVTNSTRSDLAVLRTRSGVADVIARAGDTGPVGGTLRSLGRPAIASDGAIAFRGTFEPETGGTAGIFVDDGDGLVPHLVVGEQPSAPVGGRISGLGQDVTLNGNGLLAFRATVSGGEARQIVGLASPATARKSRLEMSLGLSAVDDPQDRLRFRATIEPGPTSDGFDASRDAVSIALVDSEITIYSASVVAGELTQRGRKARLAKGDDRTIMRKLQVKQLRSGRLAVSGTSVLVDLTQAGLRTLAPPVTMRIDVGDDSAIVRLECNRKRNTLACR